MGFLSFNVKYYLGKLSEFEGKALDQNALDEVKRDLKVLDDLEDEGYTDLNRELETRFQAITRLRGILSSHGEAPFPFRQALAPDVHYGEEEFEAGALCTGLISEAARRKAVSDHPLLKRIADYCAWIGYEEDTAYIFLLRDGLLPFVYFQSRGRRGLYPWLISRAFLAQTAGAEGVDDDFRLPIYEALEKGALEFGPFKEFCTARMRGAFAGYPLLERALKELLSGIREEKIIVIESGYCGTVPMMLAALDERVDFRLYATAPFLYETYWEKVFCRRYEDIRLFETLYSQDVLTKYSSFRQGQFYVRMAREEWVKDQALGEIYRVTGALDDES